uniref:Organic cation transporter 1like [Strongylocentrotus purpuratus] n=2 Tax=Lepeophtheirus salmonis TaxID=72036 RepID=A0A0K2U4H5_LEPSM
MAYDSDYEGMDYILGNMVGSQGRAQWKVVFLAFIADIAGGVPLLLHMFSAYEPDHRCSIPVCNDLNSTDWMEFAIPKNTKSSNFLKKDSTYDSCHAFKVIDEEGDCEMSNFNISQMETCSAWVYDKSDFPYTLTTRNDLVCNSEAKRRLLSTFMMLGLMIGSLLGGKFGDWIGRKKTCFIAISIITPTVMVGGYSPNYEIYAALRLLTCICLPVIWVCIHSLTFELFGIRGRERFLAVKDLFYPTYVIMLGSLSYFFRNYEELHLVCGCLCLISLIMYFFIPESVRWEIVNNQYDSARKTLLSIAKQNGKTLTKEDENKIDRILHRIHDEIQDSDNKGKHSILDMFKKSQIKMTLVLLANWITVNVGSYTLTLEATKLSGNVWLNFVLSSVIEIPGSIMIFFCLSMFGRRFNLFMYQSIVGISCITLAFTPKTWTTTVLVIYLIGKIGSGATFLMVWLLPVELYPTNLRAQALGTLSTIARIFGMSASFVPTLAKVWKPLPLFIIGVPSLIAGLMAYFLPETAKKELPQTLLKSSSSKPKEDTTKV